MVQQQVAHIQPMKISAFCIASGLSKATITHYIKIGLLPPPLIVSSKLHLYDESHLKTLLSIRQYREKEGYSLSEIREALANGRNTYKSTAKQIPSLENTNGSLSNDLTSSKRHLLIDKAIQLFSAQGFENIKISDITDAAQIGKGTFYLYFKDKKELLYECVNEMELLLSLMESRDEILLEQDIVIRMRNRWILIQYQYPHFGGILQLLQSSAHSEDHRIRKKSFEAYNAVIKPIMDDIISAQHDGEVQEMDPEFLAYAVLGIMENLTFRLIQDSKYTIEMVAKSIEDLLRLILLR